MPKTPDENDRKQAGDFTGDPMEGVTLIEAPASVWVPPVQISQPQLDAALERSQRRHDKIERPIPVPWPDFAAQLGGGFWPGMHVLIAGTGTGKTTLALQIGVEAANAGYPVAYVGLELDAMQIALRLIGTRGRLPWSRLYTGQADTEAQWQRYATAAHQVSAGLPAGWPFFVEHGDPSGWPPSRLGQIAAWMRAKYPHPPGQPGSLPMLIILDFLQIVGDDPSADGRSPRADLRERIGRAAYQARAVAREQDAAVLVISSTARDKYGMLGNLTEAGIAVDLEGAGSPRRRVLLSRDSLIGTGKESGEVEYAADTVNVAIRYQGELPETDAKEGATGIILASPKVRHGGEGWCELRFNGWEFNEPRSDDLIESRLAEQQQKKNDEKRKKRDSNGTTPREARHGEHSGLED